jgi:nucleoside-diphosphate-sugar epimerase
MTAMHIFIAGGSGFIGSHLADRLLAQGHRVTVLDNLSRGRIHHVSHNYANARFSFIEGDIREPRRLFQACRGADVIVNLADCRPDRQMRMDDDFLRGTLVEGASNLLKAMDANGIDRLVAGSALELKEQRGDWSNGSPEGEEYWKNKRMSEETILESAESYHKKSAILRIGSVYGQRAKGDGISEWIGLARRGLDLRLERDEEVDILPVGTVLDALTAAATLPVEGIIEVGSGKLVRLGEIAERILSLGGGRSRLLVDDPAVRPRIAADTERMRILLGVTPPADPLDGLQELMKPAG